MLNEDLIGYLQPASTRFHSGEWRDVTGFISDAQLTAARSTYAAWVFTALETQTLNLAAIVGRVPNFH